MPTTFRKYAKSWGHTVSQTDTIFARKKLVTCSLPSPGLNPIHTIYLHEAFTTFLPSSHGKQPLNFLSIYCSSLIFWQLVHSVNKLCLKHSLHARDFAIFHGEHNIVKYTISYFEPLNNIYITDNSNKWWPYNRAKECMSLRCLCTESSPYVDIISVLPKDSQ